MHKKPFHQLMIAIIYWIFRANGSFALINIKCGENYRGVLKRFLMRLKMLNRRILCKNGVRKINNLPLINGEVPSEPKKSEHILKLFKATKHFD